MADRKTGTTKYVVDGKTYQLKLDSSAMVAMEEAASRPDRRPFFNRLLLLTGRIGASTSEADRLAALSDMTGAILTEREHAATDHLRPVVFPEIMQLAQSGSWKYQRILVWASLQAHHPEVTLEQAGDIMLESAESELAVKLADLAKSATPDPADLDALGVTPPANPPEAQPKKRGRKPKQVGTGELSTVSAGAAV